MPQKRDHIVFSQKTATTSEYKIYSVKDLIFLGTIKGKFKKTQWKCLDENGNLLTTLKAKKEAMDFFREMDTKRMMAKGGGIGFEKLSNKVAKNYEGDKVAPKYQHEYRKTYSKSEAKEVGDKVAGKVYWQQQGRKMAMGGSILNEYEEEEFQKWKKDGNVSKNADGTYSTQDAQFRNSLKNLTELKEYFKKEFFSDSYYANGGSVEEYRTKSIERQRKEEEGKTFAPFKAYVYENSPSGANQFNATESDSFASAVKWAKEQLISQRNFRKNSDLLWAQVSKFVPVEERNNVIYAYKDVARFDEEQVESIKYANGGSMSGKMKNFYILLDNGTKKEYTVKAPKDIAGIYFAGGYDRGATTLEKGLPMVHYDNALRPLYNQDDTLVEAYAQYAGMDYDDLKSKMEDGGNVDESYERTFRNNTGKDILVKIIKNPIFGKYDYWVDGSVRGQFDTFAQARQEVNYENFDMYKQGGTIYSKDESMNIAQTILSQMGGRRRLEAFTGAYNFAVGDGSVMFRIKNRKVNVVKVKLNGKDLYDVTFGRISGTNYKVVEESNDVYAEDLIDFFERETGMYLRMEKGGNLYDSEFYKNGGSVYPDLSLQKADVVNDSIQLNEFKIQKTKNLFTINGLEKKKITQSKDAVSILRSLWEKDTINAYEQAYVLYLNNANTVIGYYHHSKGSITGTVMDIQMIIGMALKSLARGVIIAHNHPSENKQPSDADKKITRQLKEGLKVFGIMLLDSVIITDESYFSFADEGLI